MKVHFLLETTSSSPPTRRPAAFLAVRRSQAKAQSPFLKLKGQPAFLVIVDPAAAFREICRKCRQPLFSDRCCGSHLDDAAMPVKTDYGSLLLFGKHCSHKIA